MATSICLLAAATFQLDGLVKGVIGMGLLAIVLPPAEAAALLVVPSLVTNVWQLLAGPRFTAQVLRLWTMMAGVMLGTIAGVGILASDTAGLASIGLGSALAVYAVVGLAGLRIEVVRRHEGWLAPLVGVTTGLVTGATGVFVIPRRTLPAGDRPRERRADPGVGPFLHR